MIPAGVLRATELLIALGVLITSAETLASHRDYQRGGVLDSLILRQRPLLLRRSWLSDVSDRLLRPSTLLLLAGISLVAAVGLVWPNAPDRVRGLFALIALFAMVGASTFYSQTIDAADQMTRVVLGGLAIGLLVDSQMALRSGLAFIAMQSCLAYGTSGINKLAHSGWRSGETLLGIAGAQVFGDKTTLRWLQAHPQWAGPLTWAVIVWQCAFPLGLLAPSWFLATLLGIGVLFHLTSARVMGLNNFVWAFLATYPAIIETNHAIRTWLSAGVIR